jgi:hypothetical protein
MRSSICVNASRNGTSSDSSGDRLSPALYALFHPGRRQKILQQNQPPAPQELMCLTGLPALVNSIRWTSSSTVVVFSSNAAVGAIGISVCEKLLD